MVRTQRMHLCAACVILSPTCNVFVADDGALILGDFGLVIDPSAIDARLTDTYENVGSRDWMPGWATGMRMDEVKPTFDVFSLGKLLWSMVSGSEILRLWYFNHPKYPKFDLEQIFPKNPDMRWITRILRKCVVEHETDCLSEASELLVEVDQAIRALQYGGTSTQKKRGCSHSLPDVRNWRLHRQDPLCGRRHGAHLQQPRA
jgi:hypothetical protein